MAESSSDKLHLVHDTIDNEKDDYQLINEARENPAQFAILYRRYVNPIFRYIIARVRNNRDAEDLTTEVFIQAIEGLENYRHRGYFVAWLFTIARRRVADYHRKQPREVSLSTLRNALGQKHDPLQDLIHQQELNNLIDIVNRLSEENQELLYLRCAAGLSFREIANVLKQNESTVKMSYYRLLNRLEMLLMLE
jgi:RNA polymerase sigma-70 factor (ECF subfamily)